MPMSPRLLRPRSTVHPEANAWATRVIANGGTFSSSTLSAVSRFCASIDRESGLRAAILRLNLFCGNSDASLNAVRTPLYRGASLGGTQLGDAMDTNVNFVEGDYQEAGSGGGLKGNGSSKHLLTGFNYDTLSSANSTHLSASATSIETAGDTMFLGSYLFPGDAAGLPTLFALDAVTGNSNRGFRSGGQIGSSAVFAHSSGTTESHLIGTRTASNAIAAYRGGTSAASNTVSGSAATSGRETPVFAAINGSTVANYTAARLRMYSIGKGLTAAQALAFSNAVIAFNTALGRA
jgi:hypothetical protein